MYCLSKIICNKNDEMNASQLLKIPRFVGQNELLKYWIKEWAKLNEAGVKKFSSMLSQVLLRVSVCLICRGNK